MRVTSMVAALAVVLAACGGEKKADDGQAAMTDSAAAAPAAAPQTAGATHDVDMTMVDGQPRFVPAELTIKPGDAVRFINKEGGPHNVQFWADSIPSGAASAISMDRQMSPLESEMLVEQDAAVTVTFAANAPTGEYHFTCVPHGAMGMHGMIKVEQ